MTELHSASKSGTDEMVEQMGLFFQNLGVPRAAGQMLGYLLACDPPEQTAGEISLATGLSPASISSSARLLVQMSAVEPRHRIGDRKTYYRVPSTLWIDMVRSKLTAFGDLAAVGKRIKAAGSVGREDGIDEMVAFAEFWESELPRIVERWEAKKASMREER
jgi:hypothetical protein